MGFLCVSSQFFFAVAFQAYPIPITKTEVLQMYSAFEVKQAQRKSKIFLELLSSEVHALRTLPAMTAFQYSSPAGR